MRGFHPVLYLLVKSMTRVEQMRGHHAYSHPLMKEQGNLLIQKRMQLLIMIMDYLIEEMKMDEKDQGMRNLVEKHQGMTNLGSIDFRVIYGPSR